MLRYRCLFRRALFDSTLVPLQNYTQVLHILWKRDRSSSRPININFYGKYGVDFDDKSCFVCNKTNINTEHGLLSHLQSAKHVRMILNRLKLKTSEKNMLETNFPAIYKHIRERNTSIDTIQSLDSLKNDNGTKNMIDIAPFLINYNGNSNRHVKSMNKTAEEQLHQVKRREQANIDRGMKTGAIAPLQGSKDIRVLQIKQKIRDCVNAEQIYQILNDKDNIPNNVDIYSLSIKKCSKFGRHAWKDCKNLIQMVFDRDVPQNVELYGIIFNAASDNDRFKDVFPVLSKQMARNGIDHNIVTINSLLKGCTSRGNVKDAKKVISIGKKSNVQLDVKSYTILIAMYGIANDFDKAQKMFDKSPMIDLRLFSAFLNACGRTGRIDKMLEYKKLLDCGKIGSLRPHVVYYAIFMSAFLRLNKPLDAITMFDEMKKQKYIKPNKFCLSLLHTAYLRLQLLSTNEKDRLKKFHRTTVATPQELIFDRQMSSDTIGRLIVSILHCYGQHRWYEARVSIKTLMKQFDFKYWIADHYLSRTNLDVHGMGVPEIIFFLRYAFGKDMKRILKNTNNGRDDLIISAGVGKHRQGIQREENDGSVTRKAILHELSSWIPKIEPIEGRGKEKGIIIIPASEIKRFQLNLKDKQKFLNQTTDTCITFDKYWTDHTDKSEIDTGFLKVIK